MILQTIFSGMIGPWQIILIILVLLVPLFVLIDVLRSQFKGNDKLVWILVILLLPIVGSLLYFIIGTKRKIKN